MVDATAAAAATAVAATSIGGLHGEMRGRLRAAGIETADLDARLLLSEIVGLPAVALVTERRRAVPPEAEERVRTAIARRLAGESVGRILGHRGFWTLDLVLSEATLEPRPETETVVAAALGYLLDRFGADAAVTIADLGTGTGAILLALLSELPCARGVGVDISAAAAATARENARRAGLADRAVFVAGDFCATLGGPFDAIVANPPYIASEELAKLPPEVRRDPRAALDGGPDGLDCYRVILAGAPRLMRPGGRLFFEVGPCQAEPLAAMALRSGWCVVETSRDLLGTERVVSLALPK
jgi:release factor glutamine methyltransferase